MTSGLRRRPDRHIGTEKVPRQPAAEHSTLLEDPEFPGILAWDGTVGHRSQPGSPPPG